MATNMANHWNLDIDFINRRKVALETERQEISVYTSPLTVLSYFVLYLLHEFRMALLWIISQQYLLLVLPAIAAAVYFVYQTDGAHQPVRTRIFLVRGQRAWSMDKDGQ